MDDTHRCMRIAAVITMMLSLGASGATPSTVEDRFVAADWPLVSRAKSTLEAQGVKSLPFLIRLLDRTEVVPLENTMDLIYPGAKTFYGHGWLIDYDLDCLPARAGWLLEELTFENFGFEEGVIHEEDLLSAAKQGKHDTPLSNVIGAHTAEKSCAQRHADAVTRAKSWFQKSGAKWSRFDALKAALESKDPARHLNALNWLRFGTTPCPGLTAETYEKTLRPHVVRLASNGNDAVREQATLLLDDHQHSWLKGKRREHEQ